MDVVQDTRHADEHLTHLLRILLEITRNRELFRMSFLICEAGRTGITQRASSDDSTVHRHKQFSTLDQQILVLAKDIPTPGKGKVLVEVYASNINPAAQPVPSVRKKMLAGTAIQNAKIYVC